MKTIILIMMAVYVLAWSSPASAERYQILPVSTRIGLAKLNHNALLIDAESGAAFNCSIQFDTKVSEFTGESTCNAVSVKGKLPTGQIAWQTASPNFGWIPLWSVDQKSGEITFCTAHSTNSGLEQLWCTPVATRK